MINEDHPRCLLKPVDYLLRLFNAARLWISLWGGVFCDSTKDVT